MKRGFYFSLSFISIWHHKVSDQEELQEQTLKEVKAKAIFKPFSKLLNQIKTSHASHAPRSSNDNVSYGIWNSWSLRCLDFQIKSELFSFMLKENSNPYQFTNSIVHEQNV